MIMVYSIKVASFLSGASVNQLRQWVRSAEICPEQPHTYSFRDVVALRSIMKLRVAHSIPRIRNAIYRLETPDLTEYLSRNWFATDGETITIWDDTEDTVLNVIENPDSWEKMTLEEIYAPFVTAQGYLVPDLRAPAEGIQIDPRRLGGAPTIAGTRIPYDLVLELAVGGMSAPEIMATYPVITSESIHHAHDFAVAIEESAMHQ